MRPSPEPTLHLLAVDEIAPDPDQPRRAISTGDLLDLARSLRRHGLLQPVVVRPHPLPQARARTPYMLIAGERRWAAAPLAGLSHLPALLHTEPLSPHERLMLQLEENDGELRRELPLADRVDALFRAFRASGLPKDEFAEAHGKTTAWLVRYLSLASADDITRTALAEGHFTGLNCAHLFSRLVPADRLELLERARRNRLPLTPKLVEAVFQARLRGLRPSEDFPEGPSATPPASSREELNNVDFLDDPESSSTGPLPDPATGAGPDPGPGAPGITLRLTSHELSTLIHRLGDDPRPTTPEQVHQLHELLSPLPPHQNPPSSIP